MSMPAVKRTVSLGYEEALAALPEALKAEGFGVLTEIDVAATLKKKIDVDFRRYKILGACNPALAHRALQADLDVGVLLPCNVVVYETDDDKTVISMVDPVSAIGAFGGDDFVALAEEVRDLLTRAIDAVG